MATDYLNTPSFRRIQRLEQQYGDMCEKRSNAYADYQQYVDKFYAHQISRDVLNEQYALAVRFDDQCAALYAELNAAKNYHLAYIEAVEDDCTCTPLTTCAACYTRAHNSEIEF